jgi:hypothetical protein
VRSRRNLARDDRQRRQLHRLLFPEYADAAKLWAFLLSPYDRLPARGRLYRRAFEDVASEQVDLEPVPF